MIVNRLTFEVLVEYGKTKGYIVYRGKNHTIQVDNGNGTTAEFNTVGEAYTDMYYDLI